MQKDWFLALPKRGAFCIHDTCWPTNEAKAAHCWGNLIIFLSRFWAGNASDNSHRRFLFFLLPPHKHKYKSSRRKLNYDSWKLFSHIVFLSWTCPNLCKRHWAACRFFFFFPWRASCSFYVLALNSGLRALDGKWFALVNVQNLESLLARSLGKETSCEQRTASFSPFLYKITTQKRHSNHSIKALQRENISIYFCFALRSSLNRNRDTRK